MQGHLKLLVLYETSLALELFIIVVGLFYYTNHQVMEKSLLQDIILPNKDFEDLWDRIILPQEQKKRIVAQVLLSFTVRKKISFGALPLHGVILLYGPPGTGKTSLAKAVASKAATLLKSSITFLEVDPHSLTGSALGKSQREVRSFFQNVVAERATNGPTIILLDEVETLAADRRKLSLEANPIDVHRATDAVLSSLDQLAREYSNLVFIATSNFSEAVDDAFISRADMSELIGLPTAEACSQILKDTLQILSQQWPKLNVLATDQHIELIAQEAVGLDGRQIRKAVLRACTYDDATALNPGLLTLDLIQKAILASKERK